MKIHIRHLLDNYAGLTLTIACLLVVGGFIVLIQPFKEGPDTSKAKPSPTASGSAMVEGTVAISCSDNCDKQILLSAYDLAIYSADTEQLVAQTALDNSGHFHLQIPSGKYRIKTLPESQAPVQTITTKTNHTTSIQISIPYTSAK